MADLGPSAGSPDVLGAHMRRNEPQTSRQRVTGNGSDVMLKVLEQAIARLDALPEDRQLAAAEALDDIVASTQIAPVEAYPGVDLKWPASAIWRTGEPAIKTCGAQSGMS